MIVDCAHFRDGSRRHEGPPPVGEATERLGLAQLAAEDARPAHRRPHRRRPRPGERRPRRRRAGARGVRPLAGRRPDEAHPPPAPRACSGALQADLAAIAVRRDEVVREISGRAAIVAVPTLIASVYGMNFEHMPEIGLRYGHPVVLGAMVLVGAGPHRVPERAGRV